ncbi:MAG: HtpX2, heat shock protein HtpX, heat shock protein HtpX [Candidatus Adlerbacteria bacterium]|nr:HtpX2, heat shock protein HtpX, heat shock protein HtpX [Candidatus Adlerbacteria bacterium]
MATLYTHQSENVAKTWVLMAVFLAVVVAIGAAISYYYNNATILYVAFGFAVLTNVWAYWNSDKVVISMSGAKPATDAQYPELNNVVENLAITAGLPKPKVYIIEDPAPNAFATGRSPEHAAVAVTTGLLNMMNKSELEGVLAHELSHVGNRDMLVSTVAVVLVGFVSLASNIFLHSSMGRSNDREGRGNPILMILSIALIVLAPIFATLLQLAISRKREFLADASGALLTRYPEGLASALRKIGSYTAPMIKTNSAIAHLYISNPFGAQAARSFVTRLFSTHPPVEERIKALVGN